MALLAPTAEAADPPAPDEIAKGVYMVRGTGGAPDAANLGRIGNAGFIVGRTGVLAIDAGTSFLHGQALLAAIRSVAEQPVRLVIITQARPEFMLGAAAFQAEGIPVAMQKAAADAMAKACGDCVQRLAATLGDDALRGTVTFKPDIVFTDPLELDAAVLIGRPVQLLDFSDASGPGDIAVLDPRAHVLFAGGLLESRRIPDLRSGDLGPWRDALQSLRALPIEDIVPGHGSSGSKQLIVQMERYFDRLDATTHELRAARMPADRVPAAATLPEFADWDQYLPRHGRNAALLFERQANEPVAK